MRMTTVSGTIKRLEAMAAKPGKFWVITSEGQGKSVRIMKHRLADAIDLAYKLAAALAAVDEAPFDRRGKKGWD